MTAPARVAATLLALVLAAALASCGDHSSPAPPVTTDAGLVQQRRSAGIADCPSTPAPSPVEGGLPDLALACLGTGSSSNLAGVGRGRPLLVNLWAQWCGPCRQEAPFLASGFARHGDRVDFLGIDVSDPQPRLAIDFARESGWTWPQLTDPDDALKQRLAYPGLPHTFLVDAGGRIVYQHSGPFASAQELDAVLDRWLGVR